MNLSCAPVPRPVTNPHLRFFLRRSSLARRLLLPRLIRAHFRARFGRPLDLASPRAFTEKVAWAKIKGRLETLGPLVDKYSVRRYVSGVIGDHLLVPLLAVGDRVSALNWAALPRSFVIKATHGSGWNIVVRDKASADPAAACAEIVRWLGQSYFITTLEPQYARVPPRFIVEAYLGDPAADPIDYKFHCFSGEPRAIQTDCGRASRHTRTVYDPDWNRLPVQWGVPTHPVDLPAPSRLADMLAIARRLAAPFPYVRVDLYQVEDRIYFGELTFSPGNGMTLFDPPGFDLTMGEHFDLAAFRRPLAINSDFLRFA